MRRTKIMSVVVCAMLALALSACGQQGSESSGTESQAATSAVGEQASSAADAGEASDIAQDEQASGSTESAASAATASTTASAIGTVANDIAEDEDSLVSTYASKFTQETYTDSDTGLSVTYNLFLPEGYDETASYPMVVFIADSSCTGDDATRSLSQGLGALVWATDEWQAANPCIVCVPTYPETILDDHGSYTTTEYVELTKRLIDAVSGQYAVDTSRVYGTGQSMGCMTTLILASEYPDLYAACMFVDGQWDVSTLSGLEGQKFVYFAAEDDTNAFNGMSEVMAMFDSDSVTYATAQWDGTWLPDELTSAAESLFAEGSDANFVSWATGTIDASTGNSGAPGGMGGNFGGPSSDEGEAAEDDSTAGESADNSSEKPSGSFGGPSGESGGMGGMGSASYHMASFDYAYRCIAAMEWLFQQ